MRTTTGIEPTLQTTLMITKKLLTVHPALLLSASIGATLFATGCAYENQHPSVGYHETTRVVVADQDDYVYYPQYEVYYSNTRHQYRYRDGNNWAWRSAPPGVSANVLYSSPSVRMNFHDSPEHHHNDVVRTYPRNWKHSDNKSDKHHDDHQDDHHDDRHDDDRKH